MILRTGLFFLLIWIASGCSNKILQQIDQLEKDYQEHTGFALYDVSSGKYVIQKNGDKYFTPASNTKVLTLFTAQHILKDSIPALYFVERGDSLIIWGSGSPELLYKNLPQSNIYRWLKDQPKDLYLSTGNFYDQHFGSGWAWDDYYYAFSSEKSPLPLYGNMLTLTKRSDTQVLSVDIPYFKQHFYLDDSTYESEVVRTLGTNELNYHPAIKDEQFEIEVPYHTSALTTAQLLSDTLDRKVRLVNIPLPKKHNTKWGIPVESAFKEMMQESDNFIAEQLLLVCAGMTTDSLKSEAAIRWAQEKLLKNSPDPIIWKDGSGLSRYNLVTPRTMVWLWQQLLQQMGKERLFQLIAAGGQSGTLENYFKAETPYIYGKTGTLSNNHNLSGFLISKKGKLFIFSFMNNNYPTKSGPVKHRMEKIMWELHEKY